MLAKSILNSCQLKLTHLYLFTTLIVFTGNVSFLLKSLQVVVP